MKEIGLERQPQFVLSARKNEDRMNPGGPASLHTAAVVNGTGERVESDTLVQSSSDVVVVGRLYVNNHYRFFAQPVQCVI